MIAVKDNEVIIVECKTTSKDKLYLKKAIMGLKSFAFISGAKAYISIKFDREKPRFYDICELLLTEEYTINKNTEYMSFDALIGKQSRLSI